MAKSLFKVKNQQTCPLKVQLCEKSEDKRKI